MKVSVQVFVAFLLSLFSLGAAIKCYSCVGVTGVCTNTVNCVEDSCLNLDAHDGKTYHMCMYSANCKSGYLATLLPSVAKMDFRCCQYDLCNSAPKINAKSSLIGLFSLVLFFWCIS